MQALPTQADRKRPIRFLQLEAAALAVQRVVLGLEAHREIKLKVARKSLEDKGDAAKKAGVVQKEDRHWKSMAS